MLRAVALSFRDWRVLHILLVVGTLVATILVGIMIPSRGSTILWGLGLTLLGIAIFLKPEIGLYLMVGMIPLQNVTMFFEGTTSVKLVGVVTFSSWLLRKLARRESVKSFISGNLMLSLLIFSSIAICSVFWAVNREVSAVQVFTLVQLLLWFVMLVDLVTSWNRLQRLILVMLATGIVSMAIGIYNFYFLGYTRSVGGYGTANAFSVLAFVLVLFSFHFLVRGTKFQKCLALLSVAFGILSIGTSETRAVLLIAPIILLIQFMEWYHSKLNWSIILVAAILILISLFLPLDKIMERMVELFAGDEILSPGGRGDRWLVASRIFLEYPILGVGYGNYDWVFLRYARGTGLTYRSGGDVHSLYLGVLAELGLAGLMALACVVVASLSRINRAVKEGKKLLQDNAITLLQSVRLSLIFYLLVSISLSTQDSKLFWLLLGLVEAAARLALISNPVVSRPISGPDNQEYALPVVRG